MAQDVDIQRQNLLRELWAHQTSIDMYVRITQRRRDLGTNISIVSSIIASALMVGPTVGGVTFAETVQIGLDFQESSSVWRLLCFTSLIMTLVTAISAKLNQSNDPTDRINMAKACNAELKELHTKVESENMSVDTAADEYEQIVAKASFAPKNWANEPPPSQYRSAEVALPGMAIVFGCTIMVMTVIGLLLGQEREATADPSRLVLSTAQVKINDTYSITASGFSPGEDVQFSWTGPTNNTMSVRHAKMGVSRADTSGNTTYDGIIVDKTPPGTYTITAIGLTSKQTVETRLVVQPGN